MRRKGTEHFVKLKKVMKKQLVLMLFLYTLVEQFGTLNRNEFRFLKFLIIFLPIN